MYAVILHGGKQYLVQENDVLRLEKIEAEVGSEFILDKVLLTGEGTEVKTGEPFLEGAKVVCEIVAQGRLPKIRIIKFRRRKHFMKKAGHRQYYTEVKIKSISMA